MEYISPEESSAAAAAAAKASVEGGLWSQGKKRVSDWIANQLERFFSEIVLGAIVITMALPLYL